jgi:hypothetical protein
MELQKDFKELLELLNARGVEYLIVGGYAMALHGKPRYTGDMDIFVRPTHENAEKIVGVLGEFGFGSLGLKTSDFVEPGSVVQLGVPPVRIDFLTTLSGVEWADAWASREKGTFSGVEMPYIGLTELRRNKEATGRPQDHVDLNSLRD